MPEESTTPDLVELWRGAFEAGNRRDLDAVLRFYAPGAVMDFTRTFGIVPRGQVAIRAFLEDWFAAYEDWKGMVEEPLDLGNGVVLAVVSQRGRPVGVSGYVQQREGWVWVWVEGLIDSLTTFLDAEIDEARAFAERLAQERADA